MTDFTIHDWREAVLDSELSSSTKLIALTLSVFYCDGKDTYPSISTLEMATSLSRPTVCNCLKSLENKGFIKKSKRKSNSLAFTSNSYIFSGVDDGKDISKESSKIDSKDDSKMILLPSKAILPEYSIYNLNPLRDNKLSLSTPLKKKPEKPVVDDGKINTLDKFEAWDFRADTTFQKWFKNKKENTDFTKNGFLTDYFVIEQKEAVILYCKSSGKKYKDYVATLQGFINREIKKRGA